VLQYVLLLWMSMLVLIPFDIAIVDSALAAPPPPAAAGAGADGAPSANGGFSGEQQQEGGNGYGYGYGYPPIVGTILELCKRYLASPGSSREMAAVVLGRLLTRPDMAPALRSFLAWGCAALGSSDSQRASFLVPGGCMSA
jgi:hypothetical protein